MRRWRSTLAERSSSARRWLKFIIPAFLLFIFSLVAFSPILHVREIRVIRSDSRIDLGSVLQALTPLYDRHLFFVSTRDIIARVHDVVPDASDVTVQKNYPSKLVVKISLVPLIARIMIDPPLGGITGSTGSGAVASGSGALVGSSSTQFLTQNGLLVSAVHPVLTQPIPLIRIVDWAVRPVAETPLLTSDFLHRIQYAEETLTREFSQRIVRRTVYLRAREFHLETPAISFWFDAREPLQTQLQRLRTFLKNAKLQDVKQYVDLRLIGRVVYK